MLLGRFIDWGEAQVVRGYLESNGIDCLVADTHAGTFDGSVMVGGFRLMVPADQLARAQDLVKEVKAQAAAQPAEHCPACQNTEVSAARSPLWGLFGVVFNLERADRDGHRQCQSCGYRWLRG